MFVASFFEVAMKGRWKKSQSYSKTLVSEVYASCRPVRDQMYTGCSGGKRIYTWDIEEKVTYI
jgi:hypothetical protein